MHKRELRNRAQKKKNIVQAENWESVFTVA